MPDNNYEDKPFKSPRGDAILQRQWRTKILVVPAGDSFSNELDFRRAAGLAITVDGNISATHVAVRASPEEGGAKLPVYDDAGELLIAAATGGTIISMHPETFPLGYIALALCSDADGTLTTEQSNMQFVAMVKP